MQEGGEDVKYSEMQSNREVEILVGPGRKPGSGRSTKPVITLILRPGTTRRRSGKKTPVTAGKEAD